MAVLTCRPRFVLWTALLRQLPLQLFLTLWAGMFFGGLWSVFSMVSTAMLAQRGTRPDIVGAFFSGPAAIGTLAFFAVPIVTVGAKWLNYRNTRYTIEDDFVVVEEGFFTVQSKRMLVGDIREVALRRGPLQRLSGVGSIYLASRVQGGGWAFSGSAMLGGTSLVGSGLMLMDLPDWQAIYDLVQRRLAKPGIVDRN